jgi:hypothetical protein
VRLLGNGSLAERGENHFNERIFKERNDDYRFYNHIDTSREWMNKLAAPDLIEETAPMKWIASMLQVKPGLRPTANALCTSISSDPRTLLSV